MRSPSRQVKSRLTGGSIANANPAYARSSPRAKGWLTPSAAACPFRSPPLSPVTACPERPWATLHARMVEAVAVGGGLDAIARLAAEAAGGPVAIVAPAQGAGTIAPRSADGRLAEVRRYVADRLVDRPARVPAALAAEAPIRAGTQSLGAVIALADGREPAPAAGDIVRLTALVALTALALEREEPEAARRRRAGARAARAPGSDAAMVLAEAGDRAGALAHGGIGLCAQEPERAGWVVPTIVEQFPGAAALREDGVVWALLPARRSDDTPRATMAAAQRVAGRLNQRTAVGLSPFAAGPERLHGALRQARIVLELARSGQLDVEEATTGTWRLLIRAAVADPDELAECVATSIGPAIDHDARLRTELVATFRAYLDHGENMNATASAIYVHRHTVAARLERLRALTRLDPMCHDDRERLGVGMKARAVLAAASALPH